jgi:hypothetical protein
LVSGLRLVTGIKTVVMGADWPLTALCLMAAGCARALFKSQQENAAHESLCGVGMSLLRRSKSASKCSIWD